MLPRCFFCSVIINYLLPFQGYDPGDSDRDRCALVVDESLGFNPELRKIYDLIASTRRFPRLLIDVCLTLYRS